MIQQDTIKLLRECDAGVKMGISSIDDVLKSVKSKKLMEYLQTCKAEHEQLQEEITQRLHEFGDEGKNPNPIVKSMSWLKTTAKLAADSTDAVIADLMTDGCNMGVKSLNRYLNEYKAAEEYAKDITKRLINLEEKLAIDIRSFL